MRRVAFITGVSGQDGSYLAELLLSKGYTVHGTSRAPLSANKDHVKRLVEQNSGSFFFHVLDASDMTPLRRVLEITSPTEFYHFAGQSHVGRSFVIPESTCDFSAMGTLRILEIIRELKNPPKFLNVGSSELFGNPKSGPQSEITPHNPTSPYGVAKSFSVNVVKVYREAFGVFAANAICFNHESPRRDHSFVTRKIIHGAVNIFFDRSLRLQLGNLNTFRDWGYAPEYVEGMWLMLQSDIPHDYVLATGQLNSLKTFLDLSFKALGLDWQDYVEIDPNLMRPADPSQLYGDASKIKKNIGWEAKTHLAELVNILIDSEQLSRRSK